MRRPLTKRKCQHCKTFFDPDPRSAGRQHYCATPACRKASKAASQRRWLQQLGRDMRFCRKVRFLGQNPKIEHQKFNDLQTAKLS